MKVRKLSKAEEREYILKEYLRKLNNIIKDLENY